MNPRFPEVPTPEGLREIRLQEAFDSFVAMGPDRSYSKLAKKINLPVTQVIAHAKKFLWREELAAIAEEANKKTRAQLVETEAEINMRQAEQAMELREAAFAKIVKKLEGGEARFSDLVKVFLESTKLERQARGIDANKGKGNLVDLVAEKLAKVVTKETEGAKRHEFELEEITQPLELEELDDDDDAGQRSS